MKLIQTLFLCIYLFPAIAQAEIWAFQINRKNVENCKIVKENTIDEVWTNLEEHTGKKFELSKNSMLIERYLLQSKDLNIEYSFYRSKHTCEYFREGYSAILSEDQQKILQFKNKNTKETKLAAMSPIDLPKGQRQAWVNAFAGCTDGLVNTANSIAKSLKGNLESSVKYCDCIARKAAENVEKLGDENEIFSKLPEIMSACKN